MQREGEREREKEERGREGGRERESAREERERVQGEGDTWAIQMMLQAGASGQPLIADARGAAMCAEQGQDAAILRMDRIRAFPGGAAEHGR